MRTRTRTTLAGLVLATALLGGAAWATSATSLVGADGTIDACYRAANDDAAGQGQLRVVADGEACRNNELPIEWNQRGEQGEQGPPGAAGLQGDAGPAGTAGTNGADGAPGLPGPKGDPGPPGPAGTPGADGEDGEDGATGPAGAAGTDGTDGAPGADGVSVVGAVEPSGANCADGGSRFTAGPSVTFACNGSDGDGGGLPAYDRVGTTYVPQGTAVQISSAPGFGVLNIRCIGGFGSDVQLSNPPGSGVLLSMSTGYHFQTIGEGIDAQWAAAGGAPHIVITSASLPSPGHPFAETLGVLELDVAFSFSGTSCATLVRTNVG